jgi:hypothetical protein
MENPDRSNKYRGKRSSKTPRAIIQARHRRRKGLKRVQVRWDVNPATLAEILKSCQVKVPDLEPTTLGSCLEVLEDLYRRGRIAINNVTR